MFQKKIKFYFLIKKNNKHSQSIKDTNLEGLLFIKSNY